MNFNYKFIEFFHFFRLYKACLQVEHGAQAIFGPSDPHLGAHVQSICDALEIPHLEARIDMDNEYKPFSVNVYPPIDMINQAFIDVMFFFNWTKVAIIYEEDQGEFFSSVQIPQRKLYYPNKSINVHENPPESNDLNFPTQKLNGKSFLLVEFMHKRDEASSTMGL